MADTQQDPLLIADPEPIAHARRRFSFSEHLPASTTAPAASTAPADPDTCRICRGEATPDEPLFYPCKCSGSIKYVHQDCLMEWLSHSQKKHCELCKTPFRFTKLYSPSMPKTLPVYVFLSHVAKYLLRNLLVEARAMLVASVWLGWLPYLMRSIWSFLFWLSDEGLGGRSTSLFGSASDSRATIDADGTSWSFKITSTSPASPLFTGATTTDAGLGSEYWDLIHRPVSRWGQNLTNTTSGQSLIGSLLRGIFGLSDLSILTSATAPASNISSSLGELPAAPASGHHPSLLSDVSFLQNLTRIPSVNRTIIAILEGQIITILVIICFILIILVRDYVVQQQPEINMRAAFAEAENGDAPAAGAVQGGPVVRAIDLAALGSDESDDDVDDDDETDLEDEEFHNAGFVFPGEHHGMMHPSMTTTHFDRGEHASEEHDSSSSSYATIANEPGESAGDVSIAEAGPGYEQGQVVEPAAKLATPPAESDDADETQDTSGPTVPEYLRIFREADGDADKILKIIQERHLEDKLEFWLRLTEARRNKGKEEGASASIGSGLTAHEDHLRSHGSDHSHSSEWTWPDDDGEVHGSHSSSDRKGKGKAEDTPQIADIHTPPFIEGSPLRPRANTGGPPVHQTINRLANNNWSFSDIPPDDADDEENIPDHNPTPTANAKAFLVGNAYPSPTSTTQAESGSPEQTGAGQEVSPFDVPNFPNIEPDRLDPAADFAEALRPHIAEPEELRPADVRLRTETARVERPPVGLMDKIADFMWHDVEAMEGLDMLDPPNMAGLVGVEDGFVDADEDEEADDEDQLEPERGPDRDVAEAAAAAGLDLEAMDDAEDFEGIMELVGMRGPIAGLFQNAIFCAFLVSITIFLGIFVPYNIGRVSVWILANPMRLARIMFSISKFLQDFALVIMGSLSSAAVYGAYTLGKLLGWIPAQGMIASALASSWSMSKDAAYRIVQSFMVEPIIPTGEIRNFSAISHEALLAVKADIAQTLASLGSTFDFLFGGSYLAKATMLWSLVGNGMAFLWVLVQHAPAFLFNPSSWVISLSPAEALSCVNPDLAYWNGMDRFWAVLGGYIALAFLAALYLRRGAPFSSGATGQDLEASIIDGLIQASGVMKVILIIGIEMLIFPLYCGLLLDVALLPLFENTTLGSRVTFTVNFPLTSIFVHWFVGTGYMFHFALFVSMCRKIMRKGVLYFIRDPDDPEFHPVRDVLERSVTTQLRKILFSAFVYGALVIVCLGGVVWGLAFSLPSVLPIHYSSNEPVLEFPIDLLFYNFLMPLAVKFFKPSDGLHAMYTWWFRKCARGLRITWFLFGERRIDEEGALVLSVESPYRALPWWRTLFLEVDKRGRVVPKMWRDTFEGGRAKPQSAPSDEMITLTARKSRLVRSGQLIPDGRFVRSPASDQVKIPKGKTVFLEVSEYNQRKDGKADQATTDLYSSKQYQIVYVPPHFRVRVFLFIMFIWIFAAVTGVGFTIVPLVFGRRMFKLLIPAHVRTNDVYAFSIGIYVLGSAAYTLFHLRSITHSVKIWALKALSALPKRSAIKRAYHAVVTGTKVVYSYLFLFIVFPLMVASLMELYLLLPLDTYMYSGLLAGTSDGVPAPDSPRHTVRVIQSWTLGLLYLELGARLVIAWHPDTRLSMAFRAVLRHGWLDPDVSLLTRAFILPGVVLYLLAAILPLIGARLFIAHGIGNGGGGVEALLSQLPPDQALVLIYRLSFPALALAVAGLWVLGRMLGVFRSWRVRIRDEAYLIGERLHNFGAATSAAASGHSGGGPVPGDGPPGPGGRAARGGWRAGAAARL